MRLVHFGHSCVLVETATTRLLFDPGTLSAGFEGLRDLDAILITHKHYDHFDTDRVPALVAANPNATLVVDPGTAQDAAELGLTAERVAPGDALTLGDAAVNVVGGDHAVIYPGQPMPPNVGYVVDHGAFYQPGDSIFVPEQRIDVLGVPAGAPWVKLREAIDFLREVAPRVAVPIHEEVLSKVGKESAYAWLERLAPEGTEVRVLTPGEPAQV